MSFPTGIKSEHPTLQWQKSAMRVNQRVNWWTTYTLLLMWKGAKIPVQKDCRGIRLSFLWSIYDQRGETCYDRINLSKSCHHSSVMEPSSPRLLISCLHCRKTSCQNEAISAWAWGLCSWIMLEAKIIFSHPLQTNTGAWSGRELCLLLHQTTSGTSQVLENPLPDIHLKMPLGVLYWYTKLACIMKGNPPEVSWVSQFYCANYLVYLNSQTAFIILPLTGLLFYYVEKKYNKIFVSPWEIQLDEFQDFMHWYDQVRDWWLCIQRILKGRKGKTCKKEGGRPHPSSGI